MRHRVAHGDGSLAADERDAVHVQLTDHEHLGESHLERAQCLGRRLGRVELTFRLEQNHLLERVHAMQDRIHAAVGEAEQLVGAGALIAGQALAQCRLSRGQCLAVIEIVERLLCPAQRGILNRLRDTRRGRERE